ncbi:transglutaminase domain-containing protein [Nocardioides flavescens]|uniref:Transglutaminase domain-containing protein n=1 Tax=Nocardioides flavescens TaxID=2691959 RepID=A0A6L7EU57_9ACTN|nr:transglutaminase domain-containing protein [Nocardioides flavescens]
MHRPPSRRLVATDAVVLIVLLVLAASPLVDAYGGTRWAVALTGGVLGGLAVVLLARGLRWGAWPMVLLCAVWYFVAGPALAVPALASGGVLPGPDAADALLHGLVNSWRDALTGIPPLGTVGVVLVVPFVLGLVAGLVGGTLLWRTRHPALVAAVVAALFLVSAAFGDRVSQHDAVRGVLLVAVTLAWTQFRAVRGLRINWARRGAGALCLVGIAGGVALGLHAATDRPVARAVLRDRVEPPFDPLDYPSPLSRYRAYTKDLADTELFTVSGLPADVPVRIATMDTFDGVVWNVGGDGESSKFRRVRPPLGDPVGSGVSVRIGDYTGVWVPSVGVTASVTDASGDAGAVGVVGNDDGTLAQIGGVASGATYRLDAVRETRPSDPEIRDAQAGDAVFTPPTQVPEVLMKRVRPWLEAAGSTSAGSDALVIAESFHDQGFFSDGLEGDSTSPSGHGSARIAQLVGRTQMVGNAEQYASAMAMAMQQLGHPARVVLGFAAADGLPVRGQDVTAWVEVDLQGLGWVSFDPTPPEDQTPPNEQQDPEPLPQPQVLQPADPPEEPDDVEQAPPQGAGTTPKPPQPSAVDAIVESVALGGKIAAFSLPIWLIPATKAIRRRRRRSRRDQVARASGAWREVADRARDLGIRIPAGGTRVENGLLMNERHAAASPVALASKADRFVFGPGQPDPAEVEDYWRDVRTAMRRMSRGAPLWRRPLAVFSPASIPWRATLGRLARVLVAPASRVWRRSRRTITGLFAGRKRGKQ